MTGENEMLERAPIAFDGGAALSLWVEALEPVRGFRFPTLAAELREVFAGLPPVAREGLTETSLSENRDPTSELLPGAKPINEDIANAGDDIAAELVAWHASVLSDGSLDGSLISPLELFLLFER